MRPTSKQLQAFQKQVQRAREQAKAPRPHVPVKEKAIENQILAHLKRKGVFVFKVESVGVYNPQRKRFMLKLSEHRMTGVADILGIFEGKPLAIEVKSEKGRLRPAQKVFLDRWREEGGISFVARSIEDVDKQLWP